MSDHRYFPTTIEGKLTHVIQECAEVIQTATKLQMFGAPATDPNTGIVYDNLTDLRAEIADLRGALDRFEAAL